jgi:hypothetical protein
MDDITYLGLDVHQATVCVAAARERARWEDAADRGFENRPEILCKMATRVPVMMGRVRT